MEDRSLAERLGAEASRAAGQMTWADAVKQLMAI
jgi:hypothetical protein